MQFQHRTDNVARHIQTTTVPIRYAGPLLVQIAGKTEPEPIAVLQLDTTARPDLADLARVIQREGAQQRLSNPIMYMMGDDLTMMLSLRMRDPVEIDAMVVIPWSTYRDFFFLLRELGSVYIVLGAIEDLLTNSIGLHLNRAELAFVLMAWNDERPA